MPTARAAFSTPKRWTKDSAPRARAAAASLVDMFFLRIFNFAGFPGFSLLHFIHFAVFAGAEALFPGFVHAQAHIFGAFAAEARHSHRVYEAGGFCKLGHHFAGEFAARPVLHRVDIE